jgi:hypothetical protein
MERIISIHFGKELYIKSRNLSVKSVLEEAKHLWALFTSEVSAAIHNEMRA